MGIEQSTDPRVARPLERVRGITLEAFHDQYLSGHGKPVIVTDALDTWVARSKWTLEYFKSKYASTDVLPQFSGTGLRCRRMKLYDYIQYIDAAAAASGSQSVSPGTLPDDFHELETSLMYLYWNAFSQHPELLEEVKLSPEFVEDWLPFLPEAFHKVLAGVENYFS